MCPDYFGEESPFDIQRINDWKPEFKGFTSTSYHVEVHDGTQIAVELILPKNLPGGKKIPAVLHQTRYWRAYRYRYPFRWLVKSPYDAKIARVIAEHGYAFVIIDTRGCGASSGTRPYPFSWEEVKDGYDIIEWIIHQPWSNGNVFSYGNSYSGATAELSAAVNHPALKGIVCKHDPWDMYNFIFPGGCYNEKFIGYWSALGKGLDTTKGKALRQFKPIKPLLAILGPLAVKGVLPIFPANRALTLKEAARIHGGNSYPDDYKERVTFRDDPINDQGTSIKDISICFKKDKIEKLNVPLYTFGSWQDSLTADIVIDRFLNFNNPQVALIGDWDHKALHKANPFHDHHDPATMERTDQIKDWLLFFNDCTGNGKERKVTDEKVLYYFTMGEDRWKKTTTWPPKGQFHEMWYLGEEKTISTGEPRAGSAAVDEYKVNYNAGTGTRGRWYTLLSLPVNYPDRESRDELLLTYTSKIPLQDEMEITGHPIVNLFLKTDHDDGMVIVYLEFFDPGGKLHMLSEGQFRFMHRKISEKEPPYKITVPYHSYKREDVLPVIPGEMMELRFELRPTSILLPKGSKIRLVIAGADKDNFARYPETGNPTIHVGRNKEYPSRIELPVIKRR
ncbi:MAG: CocE/NonD family hydrolase [Promethearchaeota archaeon]